MSDAAGINAQEQSRLASAVQRYLQERKGWTEDQFRIEIRSIDPGGANIVVWGIFLEDERHPVPGGGQSVELHVDRRTGEVKAELGFQ
jgi:Holliday junction resolvase-like predicted endonuclease